MNTLSDNGVNCSINYRPLSDLTVCKELGLLPENSRNATEIGRSTITLPLYPSLTIEEAEYVIENVRDLAKQIL
jgi:dTDP-4-amino-4,6-dideoxygalactose transaminase